jgi:FMN phosphatase YigB (HAD superfamily)
MIPMFVRPTVIFDLDGTLADLTHRLPLIQAKQHEDSEKLVLNDKPIIPMFAVMTSMQRRGYNVHILTGRSERCKSDTLLWLQRNAGDLQSTWESRLTMRPAASRQKDTDFKRAWYNALSDNSRRNIFLVFEDRARVVQMWRALGVQCCQVAEGNY